MAASVSYSSIERHAERLGFLAVGVDVELRHVRRATASARRASFGSLLAAPRNWSITSIRRCGAAFAAILDVELEAAGVAQPEDRRRGEGEHQRFLDVAGLHEEFAHQLLRVRPCARPSASA